MSVNNWRDIDYSVFEMPTEEKKRSNLRLATKEWIKAAEELGGAAVEIERLQEQVSQMYSPGTPRSRPKFSAFKRKQVLDRDGHECLFCGSKEDLCLDHIYPVVMGGSNHIDNLQTLCHCCNTIKGAKV